MTTILCSPQGAPEGVLDRCSHVRIGTEKVPMTPQLKAEINKHVKFYGTGAHLKKWNPSSAILIIWTGITLKSMQISIYNLVIQ